MDEYMDWTPLEYPPWPIEKINLAAAPAAPTIPDLTTNFLRKEEEDSIMSSSSSADDEIRKINEVWEAKITENIKQKSSRSKVTFNDKVILRRLIVWEYAYRSARGGQEWEQLARDNSRFKRRIDRMEPILNPILDNIHREKIKMYIDSRKQNYSWTIMPNMDNHV